MEKEWTPHHGEGRPARFLGVSPLPVCAYVERRQIPHYRMVGRSLGVQCDAVDIDPSRGRVCPGRETQNFFGYAL